MRQVRDLGHTDALYKRHLPGARSRVQLLECRVQSPRAVDGQDAALRNSHTRPQVVIRPVAERDDRVQAIIATVQFQDDEAPPRRGRGCRDGCFGRGRGQHPSEVVGYAERCQGHATDTQKAAAGDMAGQLRVTALCLRTGHGGLRQCRNSSFT